MIDRVIVNLISILIAGGGIFSVLTKFYVPEMDMAFFGSNPFAIKANIIDDVITKIFVVLGCMGVLLQIYAIIFEERYSARLHSKCFYILFSLVGFIILLFIIIGLKNLGACVAREMWLPKIVENQREVYKSTAYVIDHDGWSADQTKDKDMTEKIKRNNLEQAEEHINQIEKLLDIKPISAELKKRSTDLKKFFDR